MNRSDTTASSGNVFADLGFSPEEAQNLLLRSRVMGAIKDWFAVSELTQAAAAKKLAISQPRLNALLKGKIVDFSLDALVAIASSAGMQVLLEIKPFTARTKRVAPKSATKISTPKARKKVA